MAEVMQTPKTAEVLQAAYKNVKMAGDSILTLMPKVKDDKFKSDITVMLSTFEAFASRVAKGLAEEGVKPEEEGVITRLSAKWGSMMNTMRDSTTSHLAEMIVEGATMGMNDMYKQVREAEKAGVPDEVVRVLRDICAFEEKVVEDMKVYLR